MQTWKEWGISVEVVHGIDRPIDADIVFPQIDLTACPEDYVQFLSE